MTEHDDTALAATTEREVETLSTVVQDVGIDGIRDGAWFERLLRHALTTYTATVDAAWFQEKYPNLPPDVVVERRIALARQYAAIGGGLNAGVYSGAVAATLGSLGGASSLTLPAAVASFGIDMLFLTQLQLRLAYDLSVLYDHPVDTDDPEDLYDLLYVAFGIKAAEAFGTTAFKLGPEVTRVGVSSLLKGKLPALQRLPMVGKFLLKKNILRFAIPVVNVPLAAAANWYTTGQIASTAKAIFRQRAENRERACAIAAGTRPDHAELVLRTVLAMLLADGQITRDEADVLDQIAVLLDDAHGLEDVLGGLRAMVNVDEDALVAEVAALPGDERQVVLDAAHAAAMADGKLVRAEKKLLSRLRA